MNMKTNIGRGFGMAIGWGIFELVSKLIGWLVVVGFILLAAFNTSTPAERRAKEKAQHEIRKQATQAKPAPAPAKTEKEGGK